MDKTTISSNYMEEQKQKHAAKKTPSRHREALVVGVDFGNIGNAIVNTLAHNGHFEKVQHCNKSSGNMTGSTGRAQWITSSVDTLILCNGHSHLDWIEEQSGVEIFDTISDTLLASILASRDFVRRTIDTPWRKNIVFIGSMAYKAVLNGSAVYCAAKAGLAHYARCLAWELAPKGYNVFVVHPSNTEGTPMTTETIAGLARYRGISMQEAKDYWGACLPREKWLQPEEIAGIVEYLISGEADYLSGSQMELGGGQR